MQNVTPVRLEAEALSILAEICQRVCAIHLVISSTRGEIECLGIVILVSLDKDEPIALLQTVYHHLLDERAPGHQWIGLHLQEVVQFPAGPPHVRDEVSAFAALALVLHLELSLGLRTQLYGPVDSRYGQSGLRTARPLNALFECAARRHILVGRVIRICSLRNTPLPALKHCKESIHCLFYN